MNLWAKRAGQLFIIAVLFLMSCEDDSFLLGFKGNTKFNGRYYEFTPGSAVVLIDSLITDNHSNSSAASLLAGEYFDPDFGMVKAEWYSQIFPSFSSPIDAEPGDYVSAFIDLQLDLYSYGTTMDSEERFTLHELLSNDGQDSLSFFDQYYYNSTWEYNPTPIAEVTYNVVYDTLKKYRDQGVGTTPPTSIIVKAQLIEDDASFGRDLFEYSLGDSAFIKFKDFKFRFKGLTLRPVDNNYILGFSTGSSSRITINYKTDTDTLSRFFFFNPSSTVSFNNITTSRSGELAAIGQKYKTYEPLNGLRYLQSGSPVLTTLDITQYYDFIKGDGTDGKDSLKNIVINSAELSIDAIETSPAGMPPPDFLKVYVFNINASGDAHFMNSDIRVDSTNMLGFYLEKEVKYYSPGSDAVETLSPLTPGTYVSLRYDSDKKKYIGYITLFLQNLFDRKDEDVQVTKLALLPISPAPGKSVNRVVFDASSIKIRIRYTSPVSSNLD